MDLVQFFVFCHSGSYIFSYEDLALVGKMFLA